jgi:hypothetical protein
MELPQIFMLSLYTIVVGLAISMIYINGLNINEEAQSSRITSIILIVGIMIIYLTNKQIEFLKILKYTAIFFVGIFSIYLISKFLGGFAGYDLVSFHGVFILSTILVIGFIIYFFLNSVRDSYN